MITSIDTSWNVDKYKSPHELEHEWKLKRKFLVGNKDKYEENRLISLAQIFVNMHFLGCKYAEPITQLINKLSEGIIEKTEKWDRLSFVPASAAVEEKVKARFNRPAEPPQTFAPRRGPMNFVQSHNLNSSANWQRFQPHQAESVHQRNGDVWIRGQKRTNPADNEFSYSSKRGPLGTTSFKRGRTDQTDFTSSQREPMDGVEFSSSRGEYLDESGYKRGCSNQSEIISSQRGRVDEAEFSSKRERLDESDFSSTKRGGSGSADGAPTTSLGLERKRNQENIRRVVDSGPFGRVVVFQNIGSKEESPISVIERTASAAHMSTSFDFTPHKDGVDCKLSLDGLYLASGQGKSQKIAKESACKVAIDRLKETSFTIIVKAAFIGSEPVDREFNNNTGTNESQQCTNIDTPIADSNIGSKLLKLMGWTGGGLGKDEQGIEEPLKPYDCNIRRRGLGIENFSDFRKKIVRIIENFAYGEDKDDLIFSPEFSKDERKLIHELVRKYNLKSRSFGKEESTRRLVVFKKVRPLEIVEDLMNCGGETGKYKLVSPQSVIFY